MKKTIFNILFIIISVLLLMCGCQIADKDTEEQMFYKVRISLGCAEIQSDGSPRWEAYPIDYRVDPKYDDTMLDLINDLKTFSTSDKPTDVELIEIRFKDQDSQDESTFYLAYDYYLKNTYLNRDGIWYKTNIPKKLNRLLLQTFNDSPNSFDSITWKVQSRYHAEDFDTTDLDNLIFRYNVYWKPSVKATSKEINYKSTGFINTSPTTVQNEEQALALAAKEMGYKNPIGVVFYDKTCGYWMVELYDSESYENPPQEFDTIYDYTDAVSKYTSFLHSNCYTVIMNDKGITLETYQNVTTYRPFIDIVFANKIIHNR